MPPSGDITHWLRLLQAGMGVVYKARQIKANRVVALKMILSGRHISLEAPVRIQIEAEAVARLSRPNRVRLYESADGSAALPRPDGATDPPDGLQPGVDAAAPTR
jgi:hypothetical protein